MRYEQENNSIYMVMDAADGGAHVSCEMKMLANNRMETLLPVSIRNVDNVCAYYYDVTSRQQFGKMYEYKKLTRENVQNIILSLDRVQNEVNEYMLSLDRVMLRTDCIYVDTARDRLVFAYDVGQSEAETEDFRHGIKRLFEFIIEHYDHSQSDSDVIFVYNVYQRIVQGDYDAANLGELVNEKAVAATDDMAAQRSYGEEEGCLDCVAPEIIEDEEEVENKAAAVAVAVMKVIAGLVLVLGVGRMLAPAYVPLPISDVAAFVMIIAAAGIFVLLGKIPVDRLTKLRTRSQTQPYTYRKEEARESLSDSYKYDDDDEMSLDFGAGRSKGQYRETYEGYSSATVLLSDYLKEKKDVKVRLRYRDGDNSGCEGSGQDITVEKLPWIIGNMDRHCDTVVGNRLVSHIHACITKIDDDFYIEDMNSTNGTYVNGERLMMNSRQKISNSDVITLASISYIVEMS